MKTKTLNPKQKAYLKANEALKTSAEEYDKASNKYLKAIDNLRKAEQKMNRTELVEAIQNL